MYLPSHSLFPLLQCQELVDTYTPQIINFIEQELTPEEICTKLTLCTSTIKVFSPKVSSPKVMHFL